MPSKKDVQGYWLIGGVVAVLAVIFAVKANLDGAPKAQSDNCVGQPTANTVILLDYSDLVPLQTRDEIVARAMAHVRTNVAINERVSVFTISALSKKELHPVVSLCRPREDGNRMVENVNQIRKRFHDNFETPLRATLAVAPKESPESPIAQAITDISLSQYLRGQTNTLLIFSDMLENTPRFRIYDCGPADTVVARYRQAMRGAQERPHFQNTAVSLNLVPRLGESPQTLACRDKLWPWFFGDNDGANAKLVVDYLPGGTPMNSGPAKAVKP